MSLLQFVTRNVSQDLQNWGMVSPPYRPPCYSPSPLPPSQPPPGVYSDTGKLAEVREKWCRSLRPDGREVFKMTFPQLMPDTFSRGKGGGKKKNANERGRVGRRGVWEACGIGGLDFNQGHPATAIRASHTHTSLLSCTQRPSFLELTGTLPMRTTAGLSTIINVSVTNSEQLWTRAACFSSECIRLLNYAVSTEPLLQCKQ